MELKVKIKKLRPEIKLPVYALNGDAGMDVFSDENVVIEVGKNHIFKTGFAMELPDGYVSLIWDKSGLSNKYGLKVLGGVLDSNYRGEYMVCLINLGKENYKFKRGDKIAQILVQPVVNVKLEEIEELSESVRGDGSHGSTGK